MKRKCLLVVVTLFSLTTLGLTQDRDQPSAKAQERITKEVGHQLRMLPYVTAFDNFAIVASATCATMVCSSAGRRHSTFQRSNELSILRGLARL